MLWHDDDPVTNVDALDVAVGFEAVSRFDTDIPADAAVFVDDRSTNDAAVADTARCAAIRAVVVVVGSHNDSVPDFGFFPDPHSQTDDTVLDGGSGLDDASIGDHAIPNGGIEYSRRRQIARPSVNRSCFLKEVERGLFARQREVRIVERSDRPNVLPVSVKEVDVDFSRPDRHWEHFLAEIRVVGTRKQLDQCVPPEQVETHAGQQAAAVTLNSTSIDPLGVDPHHVHFRDGLRFLKESMNASAIVEPHHAETARLLVGDRQGSDRRIRIGLAVRPQHLVKIHPVQLVAGEDEHVINIRLADALQLLPNGVRGPLIPAGARHRLLSGQNLDKAATERIEFVGLPNVPMKTDRVELSQKVNPVDAAVQAVGNRNVDQPVIPGERHGRFRAMFGERIKPGSLATAKDETHNVFHESEFSQQENSVVIVYFPVRNGDAGRPALFTKLGSAVWSQANRTSVGFATLSLETWTLLP